MRDKLDELINGKICEECGGRIVFGDKHICKLADRFRKDIQYN